MPAPTFSGLGGTLMAAAGQTRIVRAEDVAHMGITEVIRHAPYIYSQFRKLTAHIAATRPAAAILIDFPDVNFRLASKLKQLGIPVIWFVSPQLWAWKRRRLRWVQQRVSKMLVIFPFEERFYRQRGVDAEFTGHPLASLPLPTIPRELYAAHNNLDPAKPWIALLPGSRWREIEANLPTMVQMACRHPRAVEYILPVASTIDRKQLSDFVAGWITNSGNTYIHLVSDAREALHHARASIVASGTATVQAALIGNPFVVVYKVSELTFRIAKNFIWYPPEIWPPINRDDACIDPDGNLPIAMPNLIAGRRIVPELLQNRFNPKTLNQILDPLLQETSERRQQITDLAEIRTLLTGADPIARVCEAVLECLTPRINSKLKNSSL